ncbi:hypothetical protein CLOSTMETH_00044 [[Clostridium] methylpentosum DSM 5476]|uniref:Uncharacterized protein n=1 Tax=[Clostridium] methylpentosum DSM 5476 TaxID=537013 RepID=C0E872_9FIRM|nr:hypothetical protein CLOSTMETH_00044 [[Clostridium] methylpentosum DSM 5476]
MKIVLKYSTYRIRTQLVLWQTLNLSENCVTEQFFILYHR